jgi:hypothetical protein
MSTNKANSAWQHEFDSLGELVVWYVREAITYFLITHLKYPISRNLLPVFDPCATERAVTVKNKNRTLWNVLNHGYNYRFTRIERSGQLTI